MKLHNKRVVLTGASGGIGSEITRELVAKGAKLLLIVLRDHEIEAVQKQVGVSGGTAKVIAADITTNEGRKSIVDAANAYFSGVDVLINNAGLSDFSSFSHSDPVMIERIYKTNVTAPVLLTQALLPQMIEQGEGQVVNMGSTFGSLGFAYFTTYSSSKFALRGFSEALRRELAGTGIDVTYVAPRAVKTPINSEAVVRMAEAVKMKMDEPGVIAHWIVGCIEKSKKDAYYGMAERFFVKLNGLLPRLVDKGLGKQNKVMRDFAEPVKQ